MKVKFSDKEFSFTTKSLEFCLLDADINNYFIILIKYDEKLFKQVYFQGITSTNETDKKFKYFFNYNNEKLIVANTKLNESGYFHFIEGRHRTRWLIENNFEKIAIGLIKDDLIKLKKHGYREVNQLVSNGYIELEKII